MFKNYITIAIRNIFRSKLNCILNITGLSLGIACSLLILFHVKDELSWDKGFPKADRIYRITNMGLDESSRHWAVVSPLHGLLITESIPEIEQVARFYYMYQRILSAQLDDGSEKRFEENNGFFANPEAISVFDLNFINGNPETSLRDVNTMILTESMAKKYFDDLDPVGRTIMDDAAGTPYLITGVIEDFSFNTHLRFTYLVSMSTVYSFLDEAWLSSRGWASFYTYCLISEKNTIAEVEAKMPDFQASFYAQEGVTRAEILSNNRLLMQPLTDIHLKSSLEQEMVPNSDIAYVYIFSAAALLILVIACVNFVNISTSQAFKRMKEVGIRKLLGAQRSQLTKQFLGESYILTFIAVITALVLVNFTIPFYNNISGKELSFMQMVTVENFLVLILLSAAVGTLAGIYPALFMSGFQPVTSLKGLKDPFSSAARLRKALVVFQFVISVFMIFCTIIIYQQMKFFNTKDLGYDKDHIIAMKLYSDLRAGLVANPEVIKNTLLESSYIKSVATVSNLPGERLSVENLRPEGTPPDQNLPSVRYLRVDEDFLSTLNINLLEGNEIVSRQSDVTQFIINQSTVEDLNIVDPVGRIATNFRGTRGEIVGIVDDFHFNSLHNPIEPLVIEYNPAWAGYLLVKTEGGHIDETLEFLDEQVRTNAPGHLFIYSFVDENLERLYISEARVSDIFKVFSIFGIFISCLGLFGLSAYSAELRIKEVGIRKVLGASVSGIVVNLSREFIIWVIAANIIALPSAWYFMTKWLQNFAYRIDIGFEVFLISFTAALIIAILTVSYQSIKAALANPVIALKYE
ncbi:ABC transporter permease [candidate division KSB1 bacterium]